MSAVYYVPGRVLRFDCERGVVCARGHWRAMGVPGRFASEREAWDAYDLHQRTVGNALAQED